MDGLTSPDIHLWVVGAKSPEGVPCNSKQSPSHGWRPGHNDDDSDEKYRKNNNNSKNTNNGMYLVGAIGLPLRANSLGGMSTQVKWPDQVKPPT